jgi:hypothetical protein
VKKSGNKKAKSNGRTSKVLPKKNKANLDDSRVPNAPALGKSSVTGGVELHQKPTSKDAFLTTNQGLPVSDNQNSLRSGARGPTLLEDFFFVRS